MLSFATVRTHRVTVEAWFLTDEVTATPVQTPRLQVRWVSATGRCG